NEFQCTAKIRCAHKNLAGFAKKLQKSLENQVTQGVRLLQIPVNATPVHFRSGRACIYYGYLFNDAYTHAPLRINGSTVPSAAIPSTSIFADPIIQSTWIRLSFAPSFANAALSIFSPPIRHVEYACPRAIWLAAF